MNLPNYSELWLNEINMSKILFLYVYIRIHQFYVDGHYVFDTIKYLHLLYKDNYIKNKWKEIINDINDTFSKLKEYKLINTNVIIENKSDVINLDYLMINNEFENGLYTLMDYCVLNKIFSASENIQKEKLLLCWFFLNNRARDTIGYTSYEDIGKVIGSKTTINKYLIWFRDNKIFDTYSASHILDATGIPKRGNTIVAKWENRELIETRRNSDKASKNSSQDVKRLNERFKADNYYCKLSKMLAKYELSNNFLLLRLWNELPFGFTWEAIYKYLHNKNNFNYFAYEYEEDENNPSGTLIANKGKMIDKIINVAKTQERFIMQYAEEYNNSIFMGLQEDILIGRVYENNKSRGVGILNNSERFIDDNLEIEEEVCKSDNDNEMENTNDIIESAIDSSVAEDELVEKLEEQENYNLHENLCNHSHEKVVNFDYLYKKQKLQKETYDKNRKSNYRILVESEIEMLLEHDNYHNLTDKQKEIFDERFRNPNHELFDKLNTLQLQELKVSIINFYKSTIKVNEKLKSVSIV